MTVLHHAPIQLRPPRPTKMCAVEDVGGPFYHFFCHGGIGDQVWVLGKKLRNLDHPLYVSVASENRTRPRRSGRLLDHLPGVVGWCYADRSFAPGGQDWPHPDDPCCVIGKTWSDLKVPVCSTKPFTIECNRWLEGGHRIEDWLPDLPTTHRFKFETPGSPQSPPVRPSIVLHIAGWPDVPDDVWIQAARLFQNLAHVYVVGGSYDHRPRAIVERLKYPKYVTLVEDAAWEDLFSILTNCSYCFGHASGLTAIADVLGLRGAVYNPRTVPGLIRTWNDPTNEDLVHVDRVEDFEACVHAGYQVLADKPTATWPPSAARGGHLRADVSVRPAPEAAVYAAAILAAPKHVLVVFDGPEPTPRTAAAALAAAYDTAVSIQSITVIGGQGFSAASLYTEAARTSRRPVIDMTSDVKTVASRMVTYDLVVAVLGPNTKSMDLLDWAWARASRKGTILIGGTDALRWATDAFRGRRVEPVEVEGAPGWVYVHRRA